MRHILFGYVKSMKCQAFSFISILLLPFAPFALDSARAEELTPCSLSVGITTRLGSYRTWTNALETGILSGKDLEVCQDEAILSLSDSEMAEMDEKKAEKLLHCKTEFKLELLFRPDNMTRNVTIFRDGRVLFDQDFPPNPSSVGSLKILRAIPTCAELKKLADRAGK